MEPFQIHLPVVDDVKVRLVNGEHVSLSRVNPKRSCSVNPGNGDAVSGLDLVHEVPVSKNHHGVRSLSGRHVL